VTMNREQASRLLDVGLDFVAQYDNVGNHAASWLRTTHVSALPAWAAQQAAARASWGRSPGDAIARQIATDEIAGVLTILVPVPGGGFLVAAAENWLLGQAAGELADRLEQAVQKEFGTNWAPLITVGIGAAVLFIAAVVRRPS
jgi:hypothetical protein